MESEVSSPGADLKAGVTLSYKRLAGVKENLAALYNHALYCQVLPDVLGLAHFIVHDSRKKDISPLSFYLFRLVWKKPQKDTYCTRSHYYFLIVHNEK